VFHDVKVSTCAYKIEFKKLHTRDEKFSASWALVSRPKKIAFFHFLAHLLNPFYFLIFLSYLFRGDEKGRNKRSDKICDQDKNNTRTRAENKKLKQIATKPYFGKEHA